MNETLLAVFVGVTALAIVIQLGVLIGLYASSRKTGASLRSLSNHLEENVIPLVRDLRILISDVGPKLRETVDNLSAASATVRQETERLSATANEVATNVRSQATRVNEMFTRTLDRVEHTRESVQQVINTPARKVSGILSGVAAAIAELRGTRKWERQKNATPRDEMFI